MLHKLISIFWNAEERRLRSLWRLAGQTLLMLFFAAGVTTLASGFMPGLTQLSHHTGGPELIRLIGVIAMLVPITASVWIAGKRLDRRKFSDFGLKFSKSWWQDWSFGFALGAVLMGAVFLIEWACGWIEIQGTFVGASANTPFLASLAASFVLFVCVGWQEELLSRGYHLTNLSEGLTGRLLSRKVATGLATVLSSVLFGLMHAANPEASTMSTVNIMAAGVFLAAGYVITGQLAIPLGLHISWNFFQGNVFGFPVSGNVLPPTIISIKQGGDPLITGGAFGPEAGLIGLAAIAIGILAIICWTKLRRK
jgi:membrane protease YdiL (CAAX protease family)